MMESGHLKLLQICSSELNIGSMSCFVLFQESIWPQLMLVHTVFGKSSANRLASRSGWRLQLPSPSPAARCAQCFLWQLSRASTRSLYFKSFMAEDTWTVRKHQSTNVMYLIRKRLPPKSFLSLLLFSVVSDLEVLLDRGGCFICFILPAVWSVTEDTLCSRELGGCSCLWAVVCQVGE